MAANLRTWLQEWDRQPKEFVAAAESRSARLVLSFNAALSGFNTVNGRPKTGTGAAGDLLPTVGILGDAVTASSTRSQYYTGIDAGSDYTLLALSTYFSGGGSTQNLIGADSLTAGLRTMQFRIAQSTFYPELLVFNTSSSTFTATSSTAIPIDRTPFVVAGRVRGTEITVWLNGVQVGSATLTGTARTLTDKQIHIANDGRSNVTPYLNNLFGAAVFAGAMSDGDLRQINSQERYWASVCAPRRIIVPVAAAASGGLPTLSNARVTSITTTTAVPLVDYAY